MEDENKIIITETERTEGAVSPDSTETTTTEDTHHSSIALSSSHG